MKRRKVLSVALLSALTFGSIVGMTSCGNDEGSDVIPDNVTVNWTGLETVYLNMGDTAPDPLAGVKATSSDGDELKVVLDSESSMTIDTGYPGTYTVYYYAETADGTKVDAEGTGYAYKTFIVERGTTLDNSTFDTGVTGWNGNGNAGSIMEFSWDSTEKALKVDITNAGLEYWNNQVEYNGLNLDANSTYEITFKAKSNSGRNIGVTMEVPANGYAVVENPNCYGLPTKTEYQDYKFYYTTGDEKLEAIKFGFLLGRFTEADDVAAGEKDTVWIDDVYVKKMAKTANTTGVVFENAGRVKLDGLDPFKSYAEAKKVTAKDKDGNDITDKLVKTGVVPTSFTDTMTKANFAEQYMYTDDEGNISYVRREYTWEKPANRENEWDLMNDDFNDGLTYWNLEQNDIVEISEKDGIATIKALNESSKEPDWKAQLQQNNTGNVLKAGETYYVEVKAKVDDPSVRTLRLEFCANAGGNPNAKTDMIFEKADEWTVFKSSDYTPTADISGGNVRVGLLLAEYNVKYTMDVDYIRIVKK